MSSASRTSSLLARLRRRLLFEFQERRLKLADDIKARVSRKNSATAFSFGKLEMTLSTYKSFFSISLTQLCWLISRCFISVACRMNGEHVAPKSTDLNRYVVRLLSGSLTSWSHRNRVTSRSASSSWTCRKAFSMSVHTANLCRRNLTRMFVKSLSCGGVDSKQSFKLGDSLFWRQLCSHRLFELVLS